MATLRVDSANPEPAAIERAAGVLRRGGLVAFPTETVYGLGAHALDPEAVARIYAAKGRPRYNPLIVHMPDAATARQVAASWPEAAVRLAAAFWPGPLTIVLPKRAEVPDAVSAGLATVAVRVPSHPVALALLRAARVPVAAPSANRFTELSPTTAAHVERSLGPAVDIILDGGPTSVGIESTVVDLSGERPRRLRPGIIADDALRAVLGALDAGPLDLSGDAPRPAPGMLERHYAPRAELVTFGDENRAAVERAVREAVARGDVVGALVLTTLDAPAQDVVRMPSDATAYARRLYAELHALDDAGCAMIVVEQVPDSGVWAGIRDRLERAGRHS